MYVYIYISISIHIYIYHTYIYTIYIYNIQIRSYIGHYLSTMCHSLESRSCRCLNACPGCPGTFGHAKAERPRRPKFSNLLGGSCVVISGVISPLTWVISIVTLLITPLITTHEPPSTSLPRPSRTFSLGIRTSPTAYYMIGSLMAQLKALTDESFEG